MHMILATSALSLIGSMRPFAHKLGTAAECTMMDDDNVTKDSRERLDDQDRPCVASAVLCILRHTKALYLAPCFLCYLELSKCSSCPRFNSLSAPKFLSTMEGHCLCGAITVKINDPDLFTGKRRGHFCHCRNCRRVAGGIFGANLAIESERVEINGRDSLKEYMDKDTTSDTPMARCFCMHCGT